MQVSILYATNQKCCNKVRGQPCCNQVLIMVASMLLTSQEADIALLRFPFTSGDVTAHLKQWGSCCTIIHLWGKNCQGYVLKHIVFRMANESPLAYWNIFQKQKSSKCMLLAFFAFSLQILYKYQLLLQPDVHVSRGQSDGGMEGGSKKRVELIFLCIQALFCHFSVRPATIHMNCFTSRTD